MRPLFAVDEEVLLVSRMVPQANGAYIVDDIVIAPTQCDCGSGIVYRLRGLVHDYWSQCALRKKYKRGPEFQDMLKTLDKPLPATRVEELDGWTFE